MSGGAQSEAGLAEDNQQLRNKCVDDESVISKLQNDISRVRNNSSIKIRELIELLKENAPEKIPLWAHPEAYLKEENEQLRSQIIDDQQVAVQKEKLIELLLGDSKADLQKENQQLCCQVIDDEQVISTLQTNIKLVRKNSSVKKKELIELLKKHASDKIPFWAQDDPK